MSAYRDISASRVRGFTERMALAGFVCFTAVLLHVSVWPFIWFAIYLASQLIDRRLFKDCLQLPGEPDKAMETRLIVSVAVSVVIFSSMAAYTWFLGGQEGRLFAVIAICGALLHVSLQMYREQRFLYAAVGPHAVYLLALPTVSAIMEHKTNGLTLLVLNIGTAVFLANLALAVKQSHRAMIELTAAKDEAQAARALAENASAAKSNFLAVMTHEIRTPMNAVVSAANLMKRTRLTDLQKDHVAMLSQASEVLLGLVNDVLDISKIEAGKMTVEKATLDLPAMISGLAKLWAPQISQKDLRLEVEVEPGLARYISTDPLRLRQILFNLLSNAVKFTANGTIHLKVSASGGASGGDSVRWLRFEVRDQGIGIAPEQIERIFSSFEQAEAATTRRYGGTGLGLPISRQLARLMGGEIDVISRAGEGSTFCLSLPYEPVQVSDTLSSPLPKDLAPMTVSPPLPETSTASEAPVRRVLIVDDHEVNRRIVSLFIQPLGWQWVMAANGAEALEAAQAEPFDVILMDMQMPVMGGIEATQAIRAAEGPNRQTPVIALTANALDHHRKAWEEVGVYDFLTKPIDPDLLIDTLTQRAQPMDGPAMTERRA